MHWSANRMTRSAEPLDFAVCFAGARDNYEAAIALAEVGKLAMLMTDVYLGSPRARRVAAGFVKASAPRYRCELPASRIRSVPEALLVQKSRAAMRLFGGTGQEILARRFAAATQREHMNLLCYAGYASQAFDAAESWRRKVLFQYHPQRLYETEVLRAAGVQLPAFNDPDDAANIAEINSADAIVCASSFTKRSVERVLARPIPVVVAPYGANVATGCEHVLARRRPAKRGLRMLFVGSGTMRKGIDRLLAAWDLAATRDDRLLLVVRGVDPAVAAHLSPRRENVEVRSNLSREALIAEFLTADIFILPSLCEGFAHVVPEALSLGCYTIASDATCLADVNVPPGTGRLVAAGNVDDLALAIGEAREVQAAGGFDVIAICELAKAFQWTTFRRKVRLACGL
jgi:glycosyltransferase involved in cell wall biosynthesis